MTLDTTLRRATRALRRTPAFTLLAVAILALGTGVSTLMFSVLNSILLKPLEFQDPEQLVALATRFTFRDRETPRLTGGDLVDVRKAGQPVFSALSVYIGGEMGVQLTGRAEFTHVYFVNADFFKVFALTPQFGRAFTTNDPQAAVVSLPFALRNFSSGPAALGQNIRVEDRSYTVAGVLPAGARFPQKADLWLPSPETPENLNRTAYNYRTVARLKPGVSLSAAQDLLTSLSVELSRQFPKSNKDKFLTLRPLRDQLTGNISSTLWLLMGAVFLVMLISCANVANLLLARAAGRTREIAVQAALGAGRPQLIRQLIAESALLALLGSGAGLLLALGSIDLLRRILPADLPRASSITLDWPVFAFALLLSLLATLLFGLAPAWRSSSLDVSQALKQGGRAVGGRDAHRTRQSLVVAQIALSFLLAIGAGLFLRSLLSAASADLGFRPQGVLVMYAHVPASNLDGYRRAIAFFEDLFADLNRIPGVEAVSAAMGLPAGQYGSNGSYAVEGKHTFDGSMSLPNAGFRLTAPGYFSLLNIPLRAGRDFTHRDQYDAPFTAIISESLARQSFPGEDPLGKRIMCGLDSPNWMTIVGVVGDIRQDSPAARPEPQLYMPFQQHPAYANELQVILRTRTQPEALVTTVRDTVRRKGPDVASRFTTLPDLLSDSLAQPRFRTVLVSVFAALAVLLAMAGTYSVMTYSVSQRRAEFGLRAALGAQPSDLMRGVTLETVRLIVAGAVLGLVGAFAVSRSIASQLTGITPVDPLTYGLVLAFVAAATLVAAALPAWRASRADPTVVLRSE